MKRPISISAKRSLVVEVYFQNQWKKPEHKANCEEIGIALKALDDYNEAELDIFIADFEKYKMIKF